MENNFSWTQEFKRTWDGQGQETKKMSYQTAKEFNLNKKSIIRHLLVCIDTSSTIENFDYVPTIRNVVANLLPVFTSKFRMSNPLSIISFLTCNKAFDKYSSEFDSTKLLNTIGKDHFSLQNCLKSAIEYLKCSNYNREILILTASIGSKDQESYDTIFAELKKFGIRVSFLNISGEVTLFKKISSITNGKYLVPLDQHHFEILLNSFSEPIESQDSTSCLVKLGFPKYASESGICSCHLRYNKNPYECPVCKTFICSLPTQCPICETQLVSPINISKSLYFMYPLSPFNENCSGKCRFCMKNSVSECPDCKSLFCISCTEYLHSFLNFCIYCKK